MEELIIALLILFAMLVPVAALTAALVLAAMAFFTSRKNRSELQQQRSMLMDIRQRLERRHAPEAPPPEPAPQPEHRPPPAAAAPAPAPAPPAQAPRPPVAARVVGADRDKWQKLEESVGKRWMIWAGAVVLFLAAGFFVKYAIDNRWLGPTARVVLGIFAGIILVAGGDRFARRNMRALGQGLMGGGLAILYVSLFAAFALYDLVPQVAAFAAMIVVTAAGMVLAILHNAISVSILALLGGLAAPVMVSTGQDARDALFGYLTLLDLGVLGVVFFRRWRALDIIAAAGTMILYIGWFASFYSDSALVPAMLWLAVFFIIFLLAPFVYHLRRKTGVTIDRFLLALANATFTFVFACIMLSGEHRHALGFVALIMSAGYVAMGTVTRKRLAADARSLFGFVGLAVVFCTITVPLHLELHGITLAWAVEGPVLLYLGYRFNYLPVRIGGLAVLALAVVRLFAAHLPLHEDPFTLLINTRFWSAMFVPLAAAAFSVIHQWSNERSAGVDRVLKRISAITAGYIGIIFFSEELREWFMHGDFGPHAWSVIITVWAAGSAGFLVAGLWRHSLAARLAGLPILAVALLLAFISYIDDNPGTYLLMLNSHFLACLFPVVMVFAYGFLQLRCVWICTKPEQIFGRVMVSMGLLCVLVLLSVETYVFSYDAVMDRQQAGWTALMSVSIVWGVYAAALLGIGFWKDVRALRFVALGLFFLAALKTVLVDMAAIQQIYRIISFLALGALMTGVSYLYHRVEKHIRQTSREKE